MSPSGLSAAQSILKGHGYEVELTWGRYNAQMGELSYLAIVEGRDRELQPVQFVLVVRHGVLMGIFSDTRIKVGVKH
jgi:hypothetical protein